MIQSFRGRRGLLAISLSQLKAKSKALSEGVFDGLRIDAVFSFVDCGNKSFSHDL